MLALGLGLTAWPAQAADAQASAQTTQQAPEALRAGKALFRRGVTRFGDPITASTGAGVALQGGLSACARCHGADGLGRREAGQATPPLSWQALTQPRTAANGLAGRPAYDEATLMRALREGLGADDKPLSWSMPRFQLEPREQADLVAYLRALGTPADVEPGVQRERLVLATALPLSGPRAQLGEAARAAIQACIARANREGGLYDRQLELIALDSAEHDPATLATRLEAEALAVIAPWWPSARAADLGYALPGVPVIGPLGPAAELDGAPTTIYGIAPQYADQARILMDEALGSNALRPSSKLRLALIASEDARHQVAVRAAQRQLGLHDSAELVEWHGPNQAASPTTAGEWLARQESIDAVLVLAPPEWIEAVAAAIARRPAPPRLLFSANELGRRLLQWPADWRRTAVVAVATPSTDEIDPTRMFSDLAAIGQPNSRAPAVEALSYSASCLSIEALRRAGRHVDRESLRSAIESIDEFRSGVTHRLSFAPGRRNGLVGSALATLDGEPAQFRPLGSWRLPRTR